MEISRRTDYACRIIRAAAKRSEGYVSIATIAEEEDIPYAFARSIQHDLTLAGFITTARGAHGGLALKCDPATTTVLELIEGLQGTTSIAECSRNPEFCPKQAGCAFNRMFQGADALLASYFAAITLKDLLELGADHPVIATARKATVENVEGFVDSLYARDES